MPTTPPDQPARRTRFTPAETALARSNLTKARALMGQAAESLFDLGDVLNALAANDLYAALGTYLSFRNFLRKENLIPYATARKYMVLAATYRAPSARQLGVDKLIQLLRLASWEGVDAETLAARNEVIDDRPVSDHTADSLRLANERRRAQLEARKHELASDPALQDQHKSARRAASALERLLESDFAGPDAEARAVRQDGARGLRIRIDLSLEDALELLEVLKDHRD